MKYASVATLLLASPVDALISNSVPVSSNVPGWQAGTKGAPVEMRVFYDLLCPDSKAAYYQWKELIKQDSHIDGMKYKDLVDMKITPFVLPYHEHSWTITKVIPLLQDICAEDETKCEMNAYAELAWQDWETYLGDTGISTDDFVLQWADTVSKTLQHVTKAEITALFDKGDKHDSESRARAIWKYGASNGISATPQIFVNGVLLDSYPTENADWKQLLQQVYPAPKNATMAADKKDMFLY